MECSSTPATARTHHTRGHVSITRSSSPSISPLSFGFLLPSILLPANNHSDGSQNAGGPNGVGVPHSRPSGSDKPLRSCCAGQSDAEWFLGFVIVPVSRSCAQCTDTRPIQALDHLSSTNNGRTRLRVRRNHRMPLARYSRRSRIWQDRQRQRSEILPSQPRASRLTTSLARKLLVQKTALRKPSPTSRTIRPR